MSPKESLIVLALLFASVQGAVNSSNIIMGDIIKPQAIFNVKVLNIYINGTTEQQQPGERPVKEYFLVKHTKLDWYGAAYYCKHADARLVQIESDEEKRELREFLKQNKAADKNYWTAGNTIEDSYFWHWGIGGVQTTFTDWAKSEPKINDDEACLLVKQQSTIAAQQTMQFESAKPRSNERLLIEF